MLRPKSAIFACRLPASKHYGDVRARMPLLEPALTPRHQAIPSLQRWDADSIWLETDKSHMGQMTMKIVPFDLNKMNG